MSSPVRYSYDCSPVRHSPVRQYSPVLHHSPVMHHSPVHHRTPIRAFYYDYPMGYHDPVLSCPPIAHAAPMCPPPHLHQQDMVIADLRAQLHSMKAAHHGEIGAIREEIHAAENRFRMLCDDKQKNDCDFRMASDKVCADVNDTQHCLGDIKRAVEEKHRI